LHIHISFTLWKPGGKISETVLGFELWRVKLSAEENNKLQAPVQYSPLFWGIGHQELSPHAVEYNSIVSSLVFSVLVVVKGFRREVLPGYPKTLELDRR
jgi:hypothetical protein